MYGFATNFFERTWRDAPIPLTPIAYALNAAIAIFAPLTRAGKRWTSLTSTMLGVLMALWSAVGVLFMSDREIQMAPGIPGVAAVLGGALIGVFGRRAYGERETADGSRCKALDLLPLSLDSENLLEAMGQPPTGINAAG
jgi:hypothetical protein